MAIGTRRQAREAVDARSPHTHTLTTGAEALSPSRTVKMVKHGQHTDKMRAQDTDTDHGTTNTSTAQQHNLCCTLRKKKT